MTTIIDDHYLRKKGGYQASFFRTPNRAVLEPILADLDRLWEMRHWIPEPGKPVIPNKQIV